MAVLLRGTSAAATTAGPSSALLATAFLRSRGRLLPRAAPQRRLFVARASAQPIEVCAKESITVPGRLGDLISKKNQVKLDRGTEAMDSSQMKQGTFDADGRKITSTGGSWSTRMRHAFIVENSTHRDGAIYKENWGHWGRGCPYNLADRTETMFDHKRFAKVPCFPEPECCVEHFSNEMVQIFSLMLAKTPIKSDSIQMYGYFAARDYLDGHLNYVFNRSRDNPVVVQQVHIYYFTATIVDYAQQ